jgi:hypothetical protein
MGGLPLIGAEGGGYEPASSYAILICLSLPPMEESERGKRNVAGLWFSRKASILLGKRDSSRM